MNKVVSRYWQVIWLYTYGFQYEPTAQRRFHWVFLVLLCFYCEKKQQKDKNKPIRVAVTWSANDLNGRSKFHENEWGTQCWSNTHKGISSDNERNSASDNVTVMIEVFCTQIWSWVVLRFVRLRDTTHAKPETLERKRIPTQAKMLSLRHTPWWIYTIKGHDSAGAGSTVIFTSSGQFGALFCTFLTHVQPAGSNLVIQFWDLPSASQTVSWISFMHTTKCV